MRRHELGPIHYVYSILNQQKSTLFHANKIHFHLNLHKAYIFYQTLCNLKQLKLTFGSKVIQS